MLLKDKVIIISGIGPGLGRTMAKIAAEEGAKIGLASRNQEFLNEVALGVKALGTQVVALSTDVTQSDQCTSIAGAVLEEFGRIDGLVNSAFTHGSWSTADLSDPETWAKVFDVNCVGTLRMSQAVIPIMKAQKSGAIVNISTLSTVSPFPGEAAYAASKGAVGAMTRHMANDLGGFGIRVNNCRMGWIDGEPVSHYIAQQVRSGRSREDVVGDIVGQIPLGIIPPVEDCAKAALYFLSDYSKVITGTSIDVNGGQYMAP